MSITIYKFQSIFEVEGGCMKKGLIKTVLNIEGA